MFDLTVTGLELEPTSSVDDAVEALAAGELVVLLHGQLVYLVAGAKEASADTVRQMTASGRSVLRAAASFGRLRELGLASSEGHGHCAPVDLVGRDRTEDPAGRAATVRALADPTRGKSDFKPGHVFPVAFVGAESAVRPAVPEAAAELARLATGVPVAAYCEAADWYDAPGLAWPGRDDDGLPVVSVPAVLAHSGRLEPTVERLVSIALPTWAGEMSAIAFRSVRDGREYTAFLHGEPGVGSVRVHLQFGCQPGDVFGAVNCRCGQMLREALQRIDSASCGVIVHTPHPDPLRHLSGGHRPPPQPASIERDITHLLSCLGVHEAELSCNEELDFLGAGSG